MKNVKLQTPKLLTAVVAVSLFVGCSKMQFTDVSSSISGKTSIIPIDNPPIPVDPGTPVVVPTKTSKLSSGACASDSSTQLLSCLKCDVPQVTGAPQLSAKAQALLDIMTLSCGITNKSDLTAFRPTRNMILNKLNQASQTNYPESPRTALIEMTVQGLTNLNDSSLRQKMFGGLWYQPPYSDAFETYFGITSSEAKSTFCWNGGVMNGAITDPVGVYSLQWVQCQSGDSFSCQERPEYIQAQVFRTQLQKSLSLGVTNPYSAPTPDPQKSCRWDKFEGNDLIAAKQQLKLWKSQGRKVSMNVKKNNAGLCSDATENNITEGSNVEMATYTCN